MDLTYTHIIIIPATDETASDPAFMSQLVGEMSCYRGSSFTILRPNPCHRKIDETHRHLFEAMADNLASLDIITLCKFTYGSPEDADALEPRALAKAHLEAAFRSDAPRVEVLVLLTEPSLAGIMPEVILIDFLGDKEITPGVKTIIETGGAATVDCAARSRNVLHPMNTQN